MESLKNWQSPLVWEWKAKLGDPSKTDFEEFLLLCMNKKRLVPVHDAAAVE